MCGIAGFIDRRAGRGSDTAVLADQVRRMADTLWHRGPDDGGVWADAEAGVALGHRRLSIIDLSPSGAQPMVSANGRYVIAYNGEVYNFQELRDELGQLGHCFRGHSDTEVIVAGFAEWGIHKTVTRLIGMFAIAVWDKRERTLSLVRDRIGIKPLYWTDADGLVLFASELKAFHAFDGWRAEIDNRALGDFLAYSYVPAPATIYRNVYKLEPGQILTLSADGGLSRDVYWDLSEIARAGCISAARPGDPDETIEALERLLKDAVGRRMVADVPLGAFLSGGIDSSLVAALMQSQSQRPVRTFTIGFSEDQFNEAAHAREVAKILGTDHVERYLSPSDALDLVPRLPELYDEPFADSSQLPTHLVAAITREHVTVALSGDGGDELFAGYNRYVWFDRIWRTCGWLPTPIRRLLAGAMRSVPVAYWDMLQKPAPQRHRIRQLGDKIHKLGAAISQASPEELYARLLVQGDSPHRLLHDQLQGAAISVPPALDDVAAFVSQMQYGDMRTYLPDDILTKVDRATMGVSLEARVPLLDHRVVEFAWGLPMEMKLRGGEGKWVLRRILEKYIPAEIINRPKAGFAIPLQDWLTGPLRDWAEELLAPDKLEADGLFDAKEVGHAWAALVENGSESPYLMWNILMFQAWKARWHA